MESAKKILDRIIEWVCVVLLAVMTILVTFQVVVRYFFNSPNAYTESLSKYMFVWMVMYGSAYVFGLREHMNIGFVRDHMPPKTRVVVEMLGELTVALFAAGVMIFGGYKQVTSQMIQMDAALQIHGNYLFGSACKRMFHPLLFYLQRDEAGKKTERNLRTKEIELWIRQYL